MAVIKQEPGATDAMSEGRELEVQHLVETTGLSPSKLVTFSSNMETIGSGFGKRQSC